MLQTIRDKAQGIFAWVIVGLITIPFAFWGISSYFEGGSQAPIATVNGVELSSQELQREYENQRQRLREMLGDSYAQIFDEKAVRLQALQQLIRRTVVSQYAADEGFNVADSDVQAYIASMQAFQQNGRFDNRLYESRLRGQGYSPAAFEAQVRQSLINEQVTRSVLASAFVPPSQWQDKQRLEGEQREISYLVLPVERYRSQVQVSDAEISEHYQTNSGAYVEPETVTIEYIEVTPDRLAGDVTPDEDTLRQRYEDNKNEFTQPEERHARHILIRVAKDADEAAIEAARKKAEAALQRVTGGEDFAKVAEELSEDVGSAKEGGDLGFFAKGMMVPSFDEAVFSMKPGEIRGPVRSGFGFHIIKLDAVRGGGLRPFAEVRDELLKRYRKEEADRRFYELSDQLANLSYENPDSLIPAAEALGLVVEKAGPFTREGAKEGIASQPKILAAAFDDDVLNGGNNSEMIELASDDLVVLRVAKHNPSQARPLDTVKDEIRQQLLEEKAREKAAEEGAEVIAKVKAGADLGGVADTLGVAVEGPTTLGRKDTLLDPNVLRAAFAAGRPEGGHPKVNSARQANGDFVVVVVGKVIDGQVGEEPPDTKPLQAMAKAWGETLLDGLLQELQSRADISINEEKL